MGDWRNGSYRYHRHGRGRGRGGGGGGNGRGYYGGGGGEVRQQQNSLWKPPPSGVRQSTVPSWERDFCFHVGRIPWKKLVESKYLLPAYKSIEQWDDSAGEEAFHNAKDRYWAHINNIPCSIPLPDTDMYIDKVDWDCEIDPQLIVDLEASPPPPQPDTEWKPGQLRYGWDQPVLIGWMDEEPVKEEPIKEKPVEETPEEASWDALVNAKDAARNTGWGPGAGWGNTGWDNTGLDNTGVAEKDDKGKSWQDDNGDGNGKITYMWKSDADHYYSEVRKNGKKMGGNGKWTGNWGAGTGNWGPGNGGGWYGSNNMTYTNSRGDGYRGADNLNCNYTGGCGYHGSNNSWRHSKGRWTGQGRECANDNYRKHPHGQWNMRHRQVQW